jgi:hypothetical protein
MMGSKLHKLYSELVLLIKMCSIKFHGDSSKKKLFSDLRVTVALAMRCGATVMLQGP